MNQFTLISLTSINSIATSLLSYTGAIFLCCYIFTYSGIPANTADGRRDEIELLLKTLLNTRKIIKYNI